MSGLPIVFTGYAPDYDPTTKGIITDCSAWLPTTKGYSGAPSAVSVGLPALAAACRGAVTVRKLDETTRMFAGTQTKLYERSGLVWDDISRVGDYTGGAESKWRFTQYGNVTIATNRIDEMQAAGAGDFADLSGTPPLASIVETINGFVMALDYDDGSDDFPDGWFCSALNNHEDWTPSVATQCANGRLLDTPGQIRAGRKLGNVMVAYKERSMYMGFYDGPPIIWRWQLVAGDVGAVSQEAVVEVTINGSPAHIFMGYDDIYMFDGSRPASIGKEVRRFLQSNINHSYRYKTITSHDRSNGIVYFYFVSRLLGGTTPNACLAYNYITGQWGRDDRLVEAALEYLSASITWDDLGTLYPTWDDLPTDISYDSPFWSANQATPAIFDNAHTLNSLTGTAGDSSVTTGYIGDIETFTTLSRVYALLTVNSTSAASMTHYYNDTLGDMDTQGQTVSMSNNRFDLIWSAKWHKLKFDFTGNVTMPGIKAAYEEDGTE